MSLLTRHVLSRYLLHLTAVTSVMAGLYAAVDVPERIAGAAGSAAILGRLPLVLSHVLPVAAGAAIVTAYDGMRRSGVIDILRASGVGWGRLLAPALAMGIGLAVLEAALSLGAAPLALRWGGSGSGEGEPGPAWVVEEGLLVHVDGEGGMRAWDPRSGPAQAPAEAGRLASDIERFTGRRRPDRAGTLELASHADLARRLGHDPRPETVELWTRLLLPAALVMVIATCVVSVVRQHPRWRAIVRLVLAFVVGWLGLAVSTQMYSSGIIPPWGILAVPTLGLLAASVL